MRIWERLFRKKKEEKPVDQSRPAAEARSINQPKTEETTPIKQPEPEEETTPINQPEPEEAAPVNQPEPEETADMPKQETQIPKTAEDYRREGIGLEEQEKLEEAFLKYEEAAKMDDVPSMMRIAKMYLSGKFRPVDSSNLSEILLQGGPVFPWSLRTEKKPDYQSGLEWLIKAADLGDGFACESAGNMMCSGLGCKADTERGVSYLEKAVASGQESARKYIYLYRIDDRELTDEEYETVLADFEKAADAGDDKAYELYSTLKGGTEKQLARLGYVLTAAQNIQKSGYEAFKYSFTPSGIPLIPVAFKRRSWRTFLRFNLDAWKEEYPLIAVASDILNIESLRKISWLLDHLHHAGIVGTAEYRSPAFGWLREEKEAVLIRLGTDDKLNDEELENVVDSFSLLDEEYMSESIAFMIDHGEKEYSLEVAGINGNKVEVLCRYSIGGSERVKQYFEPELISVDMQNLKPMPSPEE